MRELLFQQSVDSFDLLLFAQPDGKFREARTCLPMRTRRIVPPFNSTLVSITSLALKKELQAFTPAEPANGTKISRHSFSPIRQVLPLLYHGCVRV
jgi:hypothetical protein